MNQLYNKTINITIKEPELDFDLYYLSYNGKLTVIAEYFNGNTIEENKKIVSEVKDDKSALDITAFLGFGNIFLYLLTYDADPYRLDSKCQNTWHIICYKGENKILNILLNYERYRIKTISLDILNQIKKSYNFSKLDIVKGKPSRAMNLTETNLNKFNSFQTKLKEETMSVIKRVMQILEKALCQKDKEGRNPLHYAAMSKFPLSYLVVENILDFDFFSFSGWDAFLKLYEDIQYLEIKEDRKCDPRRCLKLDKDYSDLLGIDIIKKLSISFNNTKKELLKRIINMQDNMGDTALHVAAFHGDHRIVTKLLAYGGDKLIKNNEDKIPLDMAKNNFVRNVLTSLNKAAKNSDSKNVTELVFFGHNINSKTTVFSQAPIHKVIESKKQNKHEVLKKILDMGSDPNIKDSNSWTALHYACEYGDFDSVKILIQHRADINSYSNNHRTPLHLASSKNFPIIVQFLLDNKANVNYKDHNGCTPLHLAAKSGNIECLSLLLTYGGDLYCEDFRKWNILHYAAFQGHSKAVRFISKYDADYNILQTVRNSQNKLSIEITRDPSVKPYFMTLWHTAKYGDLDMTSQLLNEGEDINQKSVFMENTPLHVAVFNNHYLLVRLLLRNKANSNEVNKDGITPGEYASMINAAIIKISKELDMNQTIDLKDFVRNPLNKSEKYLQTIVSEKNNNVRIWNAVDFSNKICDLLEGKIPVNDIK